MAWIVWLIVAAVLGVAELATTTFALGIIAVGALVAAAVGGAHLTPRNANQFAIPHDLGGRGVWLVGDSTWPGLGTVACAMGSRVVAEGVLRDRRKGV